MVMMTEFANASTTQVYRHYLSPRVQRHALGISKIDLNRGHGVQTKRTI